MDQQYTLWFMELADRAVIFWNALFFTGETILLHIFRVSF